MKDRKFSMVKVIRKQDPINANVLALHPQFRVKTKCKECRNGVPAKECRCQK